MTVLAHSPVINDPRILALRKDFPGLHQTVRGQPLVYLDNAATAQMPQAVVDALIHYHTVDRANIHRAVHELGQRATESYDAVRGTVARFLNAPSEREIVFVRGTTEAINLVAQTWGRTQIQAGDEILITAMEHHSNLVPWQLLCEATGARLVIARVNARGELDLNAFEQQLTEQTRLVAMCHVSNALGTVNPVKAVIDLAHAKGIPVLLDGAQAVPHEAPDVQALDVDFYAFSAHKLYGPTGVGVLYAKAKHLKDMPPWHGGGDMIDQVHFEGTTYADYPHRFEAGTPDIGGVIALGAAIDYVTEIGFDLIAEQDKRLLQHAHQVLDPIQGIRPIGTASDKVGVYSFVVDGLHPQDIGTLLDMEGIAVRTGHHCAQPLMRQFNIPATVRASFAFYNTLSEVDFLAKALTRTLDILR